MIYTLIAGVNGTGKSSLAGVLKSTVDLGLIVNVDEITKQLGCSPIEAGKVALRQIDECLSQRKTFTQETTLSGQKTLTTIKTAKKYGYKIRMYYVGLNSLEESLERIKNRVRKGGHGIPVEDVTRRYENRFADLKKVLPYCDEVYFYDNDSYEGFKSVDLDLSSGWIQELREYM